jgi:hypothetical protein
LFDFGADDLFSFLPIATVFAQESWEQMISSN